MQKQFISSQESDFLRWLRNLAPESQEQIFQGVISGTLPQALVSVPCEQAHRLFEVAPAVGFQNDRFLIGECDFFNNIVSSAS
jgi:hypothetical protein